MAANKVAVSKADDKSGCLELGNGGSCLPAFLFWAAERVKRLTIRVVSIRPCRNSEARNGRTGARMEVSVLGQSFFASYW